MFAYLRLEMDKKIFPTVSIRKHSLRNGKQRPLLFFIHSGKSALGGGTLSENGQLTSRGVAGKQELLGARTVGPAPLHSPLVFDLLVLSASVGIRKEKP